MFSFKRLIRVAGALGLAVLVSGCVIAPAWGPYHHHYYHGGY